MLDTVWILCYSSIITEGRLTDWLTDWLVGWCVCVSHWVSGFVHCVTRHCSWNSATWRLVCRANILYPQDTFSLSAYRCPEYIILTQIPTINYLTNPYLTFITLRDTWPWLSILRYSFVQPQAGLWWILSPPWEHWTWGGNTPWKGHLSTVGTICTHFHTQGGI